MSGQNSNRARAKQIISLSPGIHLRKLQKALGASFSTTRYHVERLERDSEIVCAPDGRYRRLYPAGTEDDMKEVYSILQRGISRKVLRALVEHDVTNGDLSNALHLPRSTISECTNALCRARLAERSVAADGRVLFRVRDTEQGLRLLEIYERNLLEIARDGFIDLWDDF